MEILFERMADRQGEISKSGWKENRIWICYILAWWNKCSKHFGYFFWTWWLWRMQFKKPTKTQGFQNCSDISRKLECEAKLLTMQFNSRSQHVNGVWPADVYSHRTSPCHCFCHLPAATVHIRVMWFRDNLFVFCTNLQFNASLWKFRRW